MLLVLFGVAANAAADERVVNLYNCTVTEGTTIEDVHAANAKWNKYINANVKGGDITSRVLTPIVGTRNTFIFLDSYPSLTSWTAGEALESDEMAAIAAELEALTDCSENTLHKSEAS